jgi:hypothetical protein
MLPQRKMGKAPRTLPLKGTTKWETAQRKIKGQPQGRPVYEWNESFCHAYLDFPWQFLSCSLVSLDEPKLLPHLLHVF